MQRHTDHIIRTRFVFDEADLTRALRDTIVRNTGEEQFVNADIAIEFCGDTIIVTMETEDD